MRSILWLCFLFSSVHALCAEDDVGLHVKVTCPFESFRSRLEKELREKLEERSSFHVLDQSVPLGGHSQLLYLDLRYPIRPFPGEVGAYVKVSGLAQGARYLYYHHTSLRDGDLSKSQGKAFAETISIHLSEVLFDHLFRDRLLKVGYYSNRHHLQLGQPLNIELIGPKVKTWQDLIESSDPREESLLEEKLTQSLSMEEPMPEHRKDALRREEELQTLQESWEPKERAQSYRVLSKLYAEKGLKDDALQLGEQALAEDQSVVSKKWVSELKGEQRLPVERFRTKNTQRGLDVLFYNVLEYDTNIVQEEVESFTSTDTKDWVIFSSLDLSMDWSKAKLGWGHESSFSFGNETYTRYKELDLISTELSHAFYYGEGGVHPWLAQLEWGYHGYFRRGHSLMDGFHARLSSSWLCTKTDALGFMLSWQEKDFTDHFYDENERTGDRSRLEGSYRKIFHDQQSLLTRMGWILDDIGDKSLSYDAWTVDFKFSFPTRFKWADLAYVEFGYEYRSYRAAESLARVERKDAKFELGFGLEVKIFPAHTARVHFLHTDAQSTRRVSYYRREQLSLGYEIKF
jgi:hypothetical protein